MYTGKARVLRAFAREKADRLPVFDVVNKPDMYENLLGGIISIPMAAFVYNWQKNWAWMR